MKQLTPIILVALLILWVLVLMHASHRTQYTPLVSPIPSPTIVSPTAPLASPSAVASPTGRLHPIAPLTTI